MSQIAASVPGRFLKADFLSGGKKWAISGG